MDRFVSSNIYTEDFHANSCMEKSGKSVSFFITYITENESNKVDEGDDRDDLERFEFVTEKQLRERTNFPRRSIQNPPCCESLILLQLSRRWYMYFQC